MVMVDHGGGIVTLYAHNSQLKVKTGDIVQGVRLFFNTGMSTGPHLHYEVRSTANIKAPEITCEVRSVILRSETDAELSSHFNNGQNRYGAMIRKNGYFGRTQ